jgi:hypothetical protein
VARDRTVSQPTPYRRIAAQTVVAAAVFVAFTWPDAARWFSMTVEILRGASTVGDLNVPMSIAYILVVNTIALGGGIFLAFAAVIGLNLLALVLKEYVDAKTFAQKHVCGVPDETGLCWSCDTYHTVGRCRR